MQYAIVDNTTDAILERREMDAGFDPASLAHKFGTGHAARLIPIVYDTVPAHDPATQAVVVTETVFETEVRNVMTVRALMMAELVALALESMHTDFISMPVADRATFYPQKAGFEKAVAAGDFGAARLIIENMNVPAALDPVQTAMLAKFPAQP